MEGLARVMVKDLVKDGLKSSNLGYMVRGERVPEVITTVWNRLKIGIIAIDASRQLHLIKQALKVLHEI